ncbi:type II toxin-antitoxin system Phd/YefM family antitoxin [Actinomyces wuliandei]|uniref:type II toxin-antitoxin system Phd/YefM family antitoxin n=1 Tax=Actinomyces wuliandei TaxID=2057743 RepID=UPI0013E39317|nr:hypothetical protein [Actinomyces wuliandei]
MRTISKRDLNQHTAAALDRVDDAHDVIVTERGRARWRISTAQNPTAPLTRLEREGRYTPPAPDPAPWPAHPGGPGYTEEEADALLHELCGDH